MPLSPRSDALISELRGSSLRIVVRGHAQYGFEQRKHAHKKEAFVFWGGKPGGNARNPESVPAARPCAAPLDLNLREHVEMSMSAAGIFVFICAETGQGLANRGYLFP